MDFALVLSALEKACQQQRIQLAMMGGASLGLHGLQRTTLDLDFLVLAKHLPKLDSLLTGLGYKLVFRSEHVSHFKHAKSSWGNLDFLHAARPHSLAALARAKKIAGPGSIKVKVLLPADLIGFKLQAMANDASRSARDMADIESLCQAFGDSMDWVLVREYFAIFKMSPQGRKLEARYAKKDQR
jgi:hypothetical protein